MRYSPSNPTTSPWSALESPTDVVTSTSLDHVYNFLYKLTKGYAALPSGAPPHTLPQMPILDRRLVKISRKVYDLACKVHAAEMALHEVLHSTETGDSEPHNGAPETEDYTGTRKTVKEVNMISIVASLLVLTLRTPVSPAPAGPQASLHQRVCSRWHPYPKHRSCRACIPSGM